MNRHIEIFAYAILFSAVQLFTVEAHGLRPIRKLIYDVLFHLLGITLHIFPADYLTVCHRSDPKLNDCMRTAILSLQPKLADGIAELLIPSCEPLQIPKVIIRQNAGAISMESEYANILVFGLSNFTLRSVRFDLTATYKYIVLREKRIIFSIYGRVAPSSNKFRIKLWFPDLRMTSDYSIQGKMLLMPLVGHGKARGNFSECISNF